MLALGHAHATCIYELYRAPHVSGNHRTPSSYSLEMWEPRAGMDLGLRNWILGYLSLIFHARPLSVFLIPNTGVGAVGDIQERSSAPSVVNIVIYGTFGPTGWVRWRVRMTTRDDRYLTCTCVV